MLLIALGGREASARLRSHADTLRIALGRPDRRGRARRSSSTSTTTSRSSRRATPRSCRTRSRTARARRRSSRRCAAARRRSPLCTTPAGSNLPDYGVAPPIHADGAWINSPPLTLPQLRGKVVLVDFWTYSCINCLRTLPHLKAWYAAYHAKGLDIIGVHTPEFAFEHVTSNVQAAVKRLGITWPVVQDNKYKTWDNYANQYWPAEYLIDRSGHVRHTQLRRRRVRQDGDVDPHAARRAPARTRATSPNATPTGSADARDVPRLRTTQRTTSARSSYPTTSADYTFAKSVPENEVSYAGNWRVDARSRSWPAAGRALRLQLHGQNVYIVLGGHGTVHALINGKPTGTINVNAQRLYTVRASKQSIRTDCSSCASRPASRRTRSRSAEPDPGERRSPRQARLRRPRSRRASRPCSRLSCAAALDRSRERPASSSPLPTPYAAMKTRSRRAIVSSSSGRSGVSGMNAGAPSRDPRPRPGAARSQSMNVQPPSSPYTRFQGAKSLWQTSSCTPRRVGREVPPLRIRRRDELATTSW